MSKKDKKTPTSNIIKLDTSKLSTPAGIDKTKLTPVKRVRLGLEKLTKYVADNRSCDANSSFDDGFSAFANAIGEADNSVEGDYFEIVINSVNVSDVFALTENNINEAADSIIEVYDVYLDLVSEFIEQANKIRLSYDAKQVEKAKIVYCFKQDINPFFMSLKELERMRVKLKSDLRKFSAIQNKVGTPIKSFFIEVTAFSNNVDPDKIFIENFLELFDDFREQWIKTDDIVEKIIIKQEKHIYEKMQSFICGPITTICADALNSGVNLEPVYLHLEETIEEIGAEIEVDT